MTALVRDLSESDPALRRQTLRRNGLMLLALALAGGCAAAVVIGIQFAGALYRYPNSSWTPDCGPLIAAPPVTSGPAWVGFRYTQCYVSDDDAGPVANWYGRQGWDLLVHKPMAEATVNRFHRIGPLTIVVWRRVTALNLARSPTLIRIELGVRVVN